jgi:hypothetical protein
MDRTLIAFNLPNWITVLLMAALGYLLLGIVAQIILMQWGGMSSGSSKNMPTLNNTANGGAGF